MFDANLFMRGIVRAVGEMLSNGQLFLVDRAEFLQACEDRLNDDTPFSGG